MRQQDSSGRKQPIRPATSALRPDGIPYRSLHKQKGVTFEELRHADGLRVLPGAPKGVVEVSPAYFVPGSDCLYDKAGQRVPESCVRRGRDLGELVNGGMESIKLPTQYAEINQPSLFLGSVPNHWGHFLTEGISRLWPLRRFSELRGCQMVYLGPPRHINVINHFLRFADIDTGRLVPLQQAVRITTCFVPLPSFANRGLAYTVHSQLPGLVATKVLCNELPVMSERPVYLSRTLWKPDHARVLRGEEALVSMLSRQGAVIAHPQRLSLREQIMLLNCHKTFIGCWGSAFHSLILRCCHSRAETHVICQEANRNGILFDALLQTNATYVQALHPTPDAVQSWPQLDLQIDTPLVIRYLHQKRII